MKRIFSCLLGFSFLSIATLSCSKAQHDEPVQQLETPQVINATLAAGETYMLSLNKQNAVSIKVQAAHYQLSEITTAANGSLVYKYAPVKGYAGADEVTLQQTKTASAPGGGYCGNASEGYSNTTYRTTTIKFNVAN